MKTVNIKKVDLIKNLSVKKGFSVLLSKKLVEDFFFILKSNIKSHETNLKIINELYKILSIKNASVFKKDGLLNSKTFLITGKLDGISRAEAKSLIEQNSGSIISNVSKKLDYLIVGEKPTKRKINSAKELKVKILKQKEFLKMLNKTS